MLLFSLFFTNIVSCNFVSVSDLKNTIDQKQGAFSYFIVANHNDKQI